MRQTLNNATRIVDAVKAIKTAILNARYMAARLANAEMLKLYFGIGAYVSANSRKGKWGTGAIAEISARLQQELPGLKGFSATNMKYMRIFFETWCPVDIRQSAIDEFGDKVCSCRSNRQSVIDDLSDKVFLPSIKRTNRQLPTDEIRQSPTGELNASDAGAFLSLGFAHHIQIFSKCKTSEERWYYIRRAAAEFWPVTALKTHIRAGDFRHRGKLPNNFAMTLPSAELASKAAFMLGDEVFLDGINIGEDEGDVDERLLEHEIVVNIRKFMMSLGPDFCFLGEQFRVIVEDEEQFIDLLFYHRALRCLIALELKGGKFKPAYLGQLNFYLSALDDKVRHPDENPSIGIVLCREAKRSFVEMAVRDMSKPMGVAVFRSDARMPKAYRELVPMMRGLAEIAEAKQ